MPEPVEQSTDATELETLRRTNSELVARHARDKAQLTALQTETATLQTKLTEASESLYKATIGAPLRAMAEDMSTLPDLFLEQFAKHFKLASDDKGLLTLQTADGKPAVDKNGRAIPFERDALTKLLTEGDDARAKVFKSFTIVSRASGAGQSTPTHTTSARPAKQKFAQTLGLR